MILFQSTLTVKKVERKSFVKKDGGAFQFMEAICVTDEKKPTLLTVRVPEAMEDVIIPGLKAEFQIGISSYEGKDGRVWNNFTLMSKKDIEEKPVQAQRPLETSLMDVDDIPF